MRWGQVMGWTSPAGVCCERLGGTADTDVTCWVFFLSCVQRKCARLAASLDASQAQARQADSEVQEVAKAFAILQREVTPPPPQNLFLLSCCQAHTLILGPCFMGIAALLPHT